MIEKYKDLWKYCQVCNDSLTLGGCFLSATGEVLHKMTRDNDFAYIVEEENRLVMCFAASNDIKDWYSNFDFIPLAEGKTIHEGFYNSFCKFKDQITEIVNEYVDGCLKNKKNITILSIGHSRGSALATLASRHCAKNIGFSCRFVGYGCPNVGTSSFAAEYSLLPIEATRIKHAWDIVTTIPLVKMNFRAVGKEIILKEPFWHIFPPWNFLDHCNYQKTLEKTNI
jgi:predicted lipase